MLSGRWTNSHRCSWITVYVSCCNAQLNLIVDTMTCTCIVMLLSTCQLPSCNLFTQHVSYLSWRDTTSELWTPVHSFTSEYKSTAIITFCIFLQVTIISHTTVNPLFSASRWDWQPHCYVGAKFLGCVVCRCCLKSYWFNNLGFFSEGKLASTLFIPSSWGLPTDVWSARISAQ